MIYNCTATGGKVGREEVRRTAEMGFDRQIIRRIFVFVGLFFAFGLISMKPVKFV